MSEIRVNAVKNTGGVEKYLAQAWVNFNGTGTVAIRAAGNVSSITDNGVGDYTVNFTVAMPDANYAVSCHGTFTSSGPTLGTLFPFLVPTTLVRQVPLTGSFRISCQNFAGGRFDDDYIHLSIFR